MKNRKQKIYLLIVLVGISLAIAKVFALDAGVRWLKTDPISGAIWSGRTGHTSVVFDNRLWVLGGQDALGYKNDVWVSFNGINWVKRIAAADWPARADHASVVFNNKIWVLGGYGGGYRSDVWSSVDGFGWTQEAVFAAKSDGSAAWSGRHRHASVVFNNKIWVLGGFDGNGLYKNDVWSSTDGKVWQLETVSAPWAPRADLAAAVFNNKMWVIGGYPNKNDVWSFDGTTWTRESPAVGADWQGRYGHTAVVYDGKMWVIGGNAGTALNDVWYSINGLNWIQAVPVAGSEWGARWNHTSEMFNNKMWVIGGYPNKNDVWFSQKDDIPANACVITNDKDRTVDAEFKAQFYTVTAVSINKDGAGKGKVSSLDNKIKDCQTICPASGYPYNSSVTLNAVANSGSVFDHWETFASCNNSASQNCPLTMTGDVTVYAVFKSSVAACTVTKSVTASFQALAPPPPPPAPSTPGSFIPKKIRELLPF